MLTPGPADPVRELRAELGRVVDRLRSLALPRLTQADAHGAPRLQVVREVAQRVADAAAAVEGERVRALPELAVGATGDQLAVVGADLLAALAQHPDEEVALRVLADLRELRGRL